MFSFTVEWSGDINKGRCVEVEELFYNWVRPRNLPTCTSLLQIAISQNE